MSEIMEKSLQIGQKMRGKLELEEWRDDEWSLVVPCC
jgi:hypothetical protein